MAGRGSGGDRHPCCLRRGVDPQEEHDRDREHDQARGPERRRMPADQEGGEPQDPGSPARRALVSESHARGNRGHDESDAADQGKDSKVAHQRVFGEVLDQVRAQRYVGLGQSAHLVGEQSVRNPLEDLPGDIEDDEDRQGNPTYSSRWRLDPPQKSQIANASNGMKIIIPSERRSSSFRRRPGRRRCCWPRRQGGRGGAPPKRWARRSRTRPPAGSGAGEPWIRSLGSNRSSGLHTTPGSAARKRGSYFRKPS